MSHDIILHQTLLACGLSIVDQVSRVLSAVTDADVIVSVYCVDVSIVEFVYRRVNYYPTTYTHSDLQYSTSLQVQMRAGVGGWGGVLVPRLLLMFNRSPVVHVQLFFSTRHLFFSFATPRCLEHNLET